MPSVGADDPKCVLLSLTSDISYERLSCCAYGFGLRLWYPPPDACVGYESLSPNSFQSQRKKGSYSVRRGISALLLSLEDVNTSNIVSESMLAYPHSGQPVSRHWYVCISKTKEIVKKK
jgi:hypothetical protein